MCIILDTNTIPQVFDVENNDHHEFEPVYDWIINGKGKIIFGGTKYKNEIGGKFLGLFEELRKLNKAIKIEDLEIDSKQNEIESIITDSDFDDPHLISLLTISKCKLICSLDKRAYPFFKNNLFFKGKNRPKIYSSAKNKKILNDNNIAEICKNNSDRTK